MYNYSIQNVQYNYSIRNVHARLARHYFIRSYQSHSTVTALQVLANITFYMWEFNKQNLVYIASSVQIS